LRTAYGKARGHALRLALNLELLWWCAEDGMAAPLTAISARALAAAAHLVSGYFIPMAERVYGDAGASAGERNAATLGRWIRKHHPTEVHVRHMQREIRLPGLRAQTIFGLPQMSLSKPSDCARPTPGRPSGNVGASPISSILGCGK